MKFDPPLLTEGPLSGRVYVVTHGKVEPHPTIEGETMVIASVKYDVTDQFEALMGRRSGVEHETSNLGETVSRSGHALADTPASKQTNPSRSTRSSSN